MRQIIDALFPDTKTLHGGSSPISQHPRSRSRRPKNQKINRIKAHKFLDPDAPEIVKLAMETIWKKSKKRRTT